MTSHLTLSDCRIIAGMLQRKISVVQIAGQFGRHRSTIHREIRRNFWNDPDVPMAMGYWHMKAQHLADGRRKRQAKLLQDDDLREGVIAGMKACWAHQQIAGRMRHEGGRRRVCHETIYRYVYSPEGQAQELGRYLPECRCKRKARYARCLIPRFDGEILSTTHAVRAVIQRSQASLATLSRELGINPKTVAKWRKRQTVDDLKTGPKEPRSTVLTEAEEAAIVAFRRHMLLPLDDCLYALQPTIPHLTRSALHRCLQRHGISRLPDVEGDKPSRSKFKRYPIGFFHINIAEVQTAEGKLYLFVGIDRTSKFAVTQRSCLGSGRNCLAA